MPGGGLYKRVAQATATAREGPGILLQSPGDKVDAKTQIVAPEDNRANEEEVQQEVCEVKAFTVWYWTEGPEPTFVPETLYMNSKESGHKTGEPRLIVSLSSFEALSNAYVMAVEKEGIKAALLQEKEDLLQEVRVGYYKELSHLRELLGMAKEQMALARQRTLEEHERKRMEEFERQVRETDVHYFNIVDYLEPELKGIMKDAVKQFNRHLMLENFQLKDMLAVYEGSSGDAGLPERLISLLMSKGTTPAQIVKILAGMISDSKEMSDNFYDACRDVLGISKTPLVAEEAKPKRKPKHDDEHHDEPKKSGRQNLSPRPDEHSPTSEGRKPSNQRALMKEAEQAKAEAERLREELAKLKAKMEAEAKKHEQEKAEMQKKMDAAKKQAEEAEKALKAAETKLKKALDDFEKCNKELATAKQKLSEYDHTPGGTKKQGEDSPTTAARKAKDDGPSHKDLEEARKKAEEAERKLAELEARLKEANAKIGKLTETLAEMEEQVAEAKRREAAERERKSRLRVSGGDVGGTASNDEGSGGESPSPSELTPGGSKKSRRKSAERDNEFSKSDPDGRSSKKFQGKKMSFIDRDYSGVERSGNYSALLGKPMSIVEEELARERKMRINLEIEARKLQEELTELGRVKDKLDKACDKYEHDLKDTRAKLRELMEEDESDGVNDVQIFCRWLVRRYGSLENGFRAMDANKSGGMSVYEFNAGLMQMGWIKIVGRRLFKIIDTFEKGEIELEDLERVFGKFVNGRPDDEEIAENLRKAEEEFKAQEKDQLGEAMARVRQLKVANNDLETENKRLKALSSKLEMRAVGSKDGGQGMKNMERKVDLMKEGYDKLKNERDENASKMTAAMWKCREAHILQVKYMRQAELAEQELKKLQRKYDMLKATYSKRNSAKSGFSGLSGQDDGFQTGVGETSVAAMSTALLSNPQLMTGFINSFSLEEDPEDGTDGTTTLRPGSPSSPSSFRPISPSTGRPESTGTPSITLSPASTAIGFRQGTANRARRTGSALMDSPPQTSHGFRRTSTGCSSQASLGGGAGGPLTCPKCGCCLRVKAPTQESFDGTTSSNPGALRQLLAAAANIGGGLGSGDELGTEGEDSGNERSMSPEEMIANMTDEDLLFGNPQQIKPLGLGRAHKAGASYRDKIEAQANQPGKKRRWQLLFADAQEKQNESEQPTNMSMNNMAASIRGMSMGSIRPSSPGSPMATSNIVLSKESMNLLEHAKQAREKSLWKEASASEGALGMQSVVERGDSRGSGLGGVGQTTARAYGIGGSPVSQSFGGGGGRVALGSSMRGMPDTLPEPKALSMAKIGSISSQSMATSTSAPMLRGSVSSQQRQAATPPAKVATPPAPGNREELSSPTKESEEARGLPPAVANLLQPGGTSLQPADAQRRASQKKSLRENSPPERFPQGPPLQIVGNEKLEGQGYPNMIVTPPGDPPPATASDAVDRRPSSDPLSPTRPVTRMTPLLGEGGILATQMPFDKDDEGHPWHQGSHGNKNIVGMWTGGSRNYGHRRGDSDALPPQALGADLPDKGPRSPMVVKTGLRRVPAQLPQIGCDPKKLKQDRLSSSMPDLSFHHERPVVVKTPALAASMSPGYDPVSSPPQSRMRKKSPPRGTDGRRHSAGDYNNSQATFEAPWLYIGRPPPPPSQGGSHEASMRDGGTGASHMIPAALRKQFAMAASALELGSHVQRHAAVEQDLGEDFKSPLIVSHCISPMPFEGDAPRSNATSGRVLLS